MLRIFVLFIAFTASTISGCGGHQETVWVAITGKKESGSRFILELEYRGEKRDFKVTSNVYAIYKTRSETPECVVDEELPCRSEIRVCWWPNKIVELGECPDPTKKRGPNG